MVKVDAPPGFVTVQIGKACILVIPQHVYVAGLKLGKTLRRRVTLAGRTHPDLRGTPDPCDDIQPRESDTPR